MRGVHPELVREFEVKTPERREELWCKLLGLVAAEKIRPPDRISQQTIAAKNRERRVLPMALRGQKRHVLGRVPRGMLRGEDDAAEVDRVAVYQRLAVEPILRTSLGR